MRATCPDTVAGSLVLPANTSTATGQPSPAHSKPKVICFLPFLPSRLLFLHLYRWNEGYFPRTIPRADW